MSISETPCTTMLVFGVFEGERLSLDVPIGSSVGEVKKLFQERFNIYVDEFNKKDRKVVVLHYSGSDLDESWCFTDLGITPGSMIKLCMKEEIKPVLFVTCSYNSETIDIVDKDLVVPVMKVETLRTIVGQRTGIPVSIFRLVSTDGLEMYDGHQLYDYQVDASQTLKMENWDGWNEFINLCVMGFTPQVLAQIATDEVLSRFQMKVALFIAAHYGCTDLARCLIKQGIRADEPIGEHPSRMWCPELSHIETRKTPIHEATENGQLGVLRLMVNHDITTVMAKDGHGLNPLNIALRRKQKPCASFLLTRQWTKVPVGKFGSITVQTLRKVKMWCLRSKGKAFAKFGQARSTMKKRSYVSGAMVSNGLPVVNGFTPSPMTGKAKSEMRDREKQKSIDTFHEVYGIQGDPEIYFKHINSVSNFKGLKMGRTTKWGQMLDRSDVAITLAQGLPPAESEADSNEPKSKIKSSRTDSETDADNAKKRKTHASAAAESVTSDKQGRHTRKNSIAQDNPFADSDGKVQPAKTTFANKSSKKSRTEDKENKTDGKGDDGKQSKVPKLPPLTQTQRSVAEGAIKEEDEDESVIGDSKQKSKFFQTPLRSSRSLPSINVSKSKTNLIGETPHSPRSVAGQSEKSDAKKKKRMSSAVLLSKAKAASDGAVPLPLISTENIRRPFFYHNGQRDEDVVQPILDLVSAYQGTSSRDRAIKSLTIANTFKEKAWLHQIRMAMTLSTQSVKRIIQTEDS